MHLAVATSLLSIPPFTFLLTPTGRSLVATAWAWLKGAFGKIAASSPRGFLFVLREKSRKGDEFDLLISTHDPETVARLLQSSSTSVLKQLPPALGGESPTQPHVPANPEPLQPLLPPRLTAPQVLDSNESGSTKAAAPTKRRQGRTRGGPRSQSSRRVGCRRRNNGSTSGAEEGVRFFVATGGGVTC